jgi:hypothetical protein
MPMNWKINKEDDFLNLDKHPVYKKDLESLTIEIKGSTFDIFLRGIFSIKKRKVFSLDEKKEIYKVTIEDLNYEISYIGVYINIGDSGSYNYMYPMLKAGGALSKTHKKILIAKKNKINFCIDSDGKLIL